MIFHYVAHQPDEHQVNRAAERLGHGRHYPVIGIAEVDEGVDAATREETLGGACRIPACHGRFQQGGQASIGGGCQAAYRPMGERIGRFEGNCIELMGFELCMTAVKLRDYFEIGDQSAQLRRRAEIELRASLISNG